MSKFSELIPRFLRGHTDSELLAIPKQSPEDAARAQAWRDKYFEFIDEHLTVTFNHGEMTIHSDGEAYDPSDNDTMKA